MLKVYTSKKRLTRARSHTREKQHRYVGIQSVNQPTSFVLLLKPKPEKRSPQFVFSYPLLMIKRFSFRVEPELVEAEKVPEHRSKSSGFQSRINNSLKCVTVLSRLTGLGVKDENSQDTFKKFRVPGGLLRDTHRCAIKATRKKLVCAHTTYVQIEENAHVLLELRNIFRV